MLKLVPMLRLRNSATMMLLLISFTTIEGAAANILLPSPVKGPSRQQPLHASLNLRGGMPTCDAVQKQNDELLRQNQELLRQNEEILRQNLELRRTRAPEISSDAGPAPGDIPGLLCLPGGGHPSKTADSRAD